MSDVLKKLTREMEKVQEPKRFVHTQGVEYTAAALAMRYGEDVERAQVAGLLHDCAKCMGNDKLLSACEKHHIIFCTPRWEAIWRRKNTRWKIRKS